MLIAIIIILTSVLIFPQTTEDRAYLLSRVKISGGFVTVLSEERNFDIDYPFLNLSYRSSGFDKFSSSLKLKGAYEVGLNALLIADKTPASRNAFALFPLPYFKVGPELRLYRNIFLAANGGLAIIPFPASLGAIPFIGVNTFYLVRFGDSTCIEFETGFHMPIINFSNTAYLTYLTVGIAFD